MNLTEVKISVIMPVYNSGPYLRRAIESILEQSFKEFELILVDDGSTDGSSEICDEFCDKDSRIRVIHQQNGGICNARNVALDVAKGEYLAFSDHDDEYLPNLLLDNYNFARKEELDFLKFSKVWDVYLGNKKISSTTNSMPELILDRKSLKNHIIKLNKEDFFSCVWDGLYKRSFVENNKLRFDTFFKYGGEDYDFIYRCVICANKVGINPKAYYHHYTRQNFSTSSKFDPLKIEVTKRRFSCFKLMIDSYGLDLNSNKEEYVRFFIKDCVVAIVNQLNRCLYSYNEKRTILLDLKHESYYYEFIRYHKLSWQKYRHLRLVQELFIGEHFRALLYVYKIKTKIRNYFLYL